MLFGYRQCWHQVPGDPQSPWHLLSFPLMVQGMLPLRLVLTGSGGDSGQMGVMRSVGCCQPVPDLPNF